MTTLSTDAIDERHRALRLCVPSALETMRRSVERHGVLQPLVVNAASDGAAVLVDGFKRLTVLRDRGAQEAPVRWLHLGEAEAAAAIVASNRPHRGLTELEEAWVIRQLVRTHRLEQVAVGRLLGRHKSWVCRRLALAEQLAGSVQDDVRLGLVSVTVARAVARLPRGNQVEVTEAIGRHDLSSRQAAILVSLWLQSPDGAVRAALVADPMSFVGSAARPPSRDGRLSTLLESARRSLTRLESSAVSARRHILELVPVTLSASERAALARPLLRGLAAARDAVVEIEVAAAGWEMEGDDVA